MNIKQQIISDLQTIHPQKIVLFGSLSEGRFIAGESDIDLLIVCNTDKPMGERYRDVRLALTAGYPFDIFVLTEEELEEKKKRSFFLREILHKGEVLYEQHNR